MWVSPRFALDDPARAVALIRDHGFATLICGLEASHVPVLVCGEDPLRLEGHMARANPQWRTLRDEGEALLVFLGPHDYVSPAWYAEPGTYVPTWNYAAVHVRGRAQLVEDPAEAFALLERTVAHFEGGREHPWQLEESMDQARRIAPGTVAFTIEPTEVRWQFKLSQDKPDAVRQRVIDGFEQSNPPLAELMREVP